ncbi:Protein of unknown function [Tenacibaculum jejuense]|uniref:Uncharacterized protein n=1 Tax=Tenacibaculum jejuense TaxID=584609 RepID=A0A238U809_9FLAO|nr:Protein of unknown function [Tenacibaculum jejuense]
MLFATKKQKRYKVRRTKIKFLMLPIVYKGKFLWLSRVKLETAFNGYKMMIIGIERI